MRKRRSKELQRMIVKSYDFYRETVDAVNGLSADSERTLALFGYCNIALEHLHSIILLIDVGGHDRSALALFRCLVEATYRGLYVQFCVTDAEVTELLSTEFKFSKFTEMTRKLDERFKVNGGFGIPNEVWNSANIQVSSSCQDNTVLMVRSSQIILSSSLKPSLSLQLKKLP